LRRVRHTERAGNYSHVGHITIATSLIQWKLSIPLVCGKKTVRFNDMNPTQQVRVTGAIRTSITCNSVYMCVNRFDSVDRALCFGGRTIGSSDKEIGRALQSSPRIALKVGMLGHTSHGKRMQRL